MVKRKQPAEDDGEDSSGAPAEESNHRSSRRRRPTQKQAQNLEDEHTKVDKEIEKLQAQLRSLKKAAKKRADEPAPASGDDEDREPEHDFESEEEDEDVVQQRLHKSAFQSRGIQEAPATATQRLRREGEKARPTAATAPALDMTPNPLPPPTSVPPAGEHPHMPSSHSPLPLGMPATSSSESSRAPSVSSTHSHAHSHRAAPPHAPFRHQSLSPRDRGRYRSREHLPYDWSPSPHLSTSRPSSHDRENVRRYRHGRAHSHEREYELHRHRHEDEYTNRGRTLHTGEAVDRPRHTSASTTSSCMTSSAVPHAISSASSHTTSSASSRATSSAPSHVAVASPLLPGQTESSLPTACPAPFKDGKTPSGKPKAGDYEPHVSKLINRACHQYEVLVATEQPFPDIGLPVTWASRVWADVCRAAQVNYSFCDRLERIITARASHARGVLRDKIKPLVVSTYGLLTDGSERSKSKNIARYTFLLDRDALTPEPRFHYKDVETKEGFAHNKIITTVIKEQWFTDAGAAGIKYAAQFSPIREETLALIFTTIEFCLDQWASGHYDKYITFSDKVYRKKYEAHLGQIRDWSKINPETTRAIRQRLYNHARRFSGAPPEANTLSGLSEASRDRLRLELEAQAAAQDSGDEGGS